MLRKISTLLVAAVLTIASAQAKIWRVNNTPGIPADFTLASNAVKGASAGDTIQFEPSIIPYGSITLSKKLVLVGTGYFVNDSVPSYQFSPNCPSLNFITVTSGGSGSVIMVKNRGISLYGDSNIIIQRCYIDSFGVQVYGCMNCTIRGCIIGYPNTNLTLRIGDFASPANGSTGIMCTNNILSLVVVDQYSSATITNNVIYAIADDDYGNIYNTTLINNIIVSNMINFHDCPSVSYNLFSVTSFNTLDNSPASNNQLGVIMSQTLLNGGTLGNNGYINETGFQKVSGGPADGTGQGGTDIGAFGGLFPYKMAMQPPVPAIYQLSVPSQAGNSITITIGTNSNN
jgi:hypothetical protein